MTIAQIVIMTCGMTAVYLTQQNNVKLKKYACILGLISQPFWFYTSYNHEQWGIFISSILYTYCWLLGFKNNWLNNKEVKDNG